MDEVVLTKDERRNLFRLLSEIKGYSDELAEKSRPMFDGKRFLTDAELARRLGVSRSTLSNYRIKGIFGYYAVGGKILYADCEIESFLTANYHPPYRQGQ